MYPKQKVSLVGCWKPGTCLAHDRLQTDLATKCAVFNQKAVQQSRGKHGPVKANTPFQFTATRGLLTTFPVLRVAFPVHCGAHYCLKNMKTQYLYKDFSECRISRRPCSKNTTRRNRVLPPHQTEPRVTAPGPESSHVIKTIQHISCQLKRHSNQRLISLSAHSQYTCMHQYGACRPKPARKAPPGAVDPRPLPGRYILYDLPGLPATKNKPFSHHEQPECRRHPHQPGIR